MKNTSKEELNNNSIEYRLNKDGTNNPKYVDLLDEDKPVAAQKFSCISFLSPDNLIKDRNHFNFSEFLKQWEMSKSFEKYTQFLNYLSFKYSLDFDDLTKDLQSFCEEEKDNVISGTLEDEFKNFIDANESRLDEKFNNENSFQTNTRGIKIRGSYPTQQEAELRCKLLREIDPNHDIYVCPVGLWVPFHPEAYKTGRVEYLEDELNQLMHEKQKNEQRAKQEFDKRVREAKEKAIEDNKKKARESGNVLTQTITDSGDLVNIKNVNSTEMQLENSETVTAADVRKELFEGDNIVIDYKNSDHGLSEEQKKLVSSVPLETVNENDTDTDALKAKEVVALAQKALEEEKKE